MNLNRPLDISLIGLKVNIPKLTCDNEKADWLTRVLIRIEAYAPWGT